MITIAYYNDELIQGQEQLLEALADIERTTFSDAWTKEMLASSLQQAWNHLWVAVVQGMPCGYLIANVVADETELLRIAVNKENQNAGIGQMLTVSYLSFAKKNCTRGLLEVRHGNAAAKHLYEKNGYRMFSTRKNYYKNPPEDADIYELNL